MYQPGCILFFAGLRLLTSTHPHKQDDSSATREIGRGLVDRHRNHAIKIGLRKTARYRHSFHLGSDSDEAHTSPTRLYPPEAVPTGHEQNTAGMQPTPGVGCGKALPHQQATTSLHDAHAWSVQFAVHATRAA